MFFSGQKVTRWGGEHEYKGKTLRSKSDPNGIWVEKVLFRSENDPRTENPISLARIFATQDDDSRMCFMQVSGSICSALLCGSGETVLPACFTYPLSHRGAFFFFLYGI
jgi:hypothetical protein